MKTKSAGPITLSTSTSTEASLRKDTFPDSPGKWKQTDFAYDHREYNGRGGIPEYISQQSCAGIHPKNDRSCHAICEVCGETYHCKHVTDHNAEVVVPERRADAFDAIISIDSSYCVQKNCFHLVAMPSIQVDSDLHHPNFVVDRRHDKS